MQKVAILLWLYHIDKWPLIKNLLEPIKERISLFAGVCSETCSESFYTEINDFCSDTEGKLSYFENIGKDLNSFLYQISELDAKKYPIFIKLHSQRKRLSNRYSLPWLEYLLNDLIGDEETFINNVGEFYRNQECGMIANAFLEINIDDYYQQNKHNIDKICDVMGVDVDFVENKSFIGGSMFMSRTDIFKKHITNKIADSINSLLHNETPENNQNFLKNMEMIFGYLPQYYKLKIFPSQLKLVYSTDVNDIDIVRCPNNIIYIKQIPFISGKIVEEDHNYLSIKWSSIFTSFSPQKFFLDNQKLKISFVDSLDKLGV